MYNRYIRDSRGAYTRVPEEDRPPEREERLPFPAGREAGPPHRREEAPEREERRPSYREEALEREERRPPHEEDRDRRPPPGPPPGPPHRPPPAPPEESGDGLSGVLRHFLDRFHLDHVDTGDLLLLGLLFFLFREDADEELLVARGLLLIL
ncbi:MAG: hypothetical protein IJ221_03635 [Oscillibacter sp.]|nr:hypothetical protein [Oscillibacter sp.]